MPKPIKIGFCRQFVQTGEKDVDGIGGMQEKDFADTDISQRREYNWRETFQICDMLEGFSDIKVMKGIFQHSEETDEISFSDSHFIKAILVAGDSADPGDSVGVTSQAEFFIKTHQQDSVGISSQMDAFRLTPYMMLDTMRVG